MPSSMMCLLLSRRPVELDVMERLAYRINFLSLASKLMGCDQTSTMTPANLLNYHVRILNCGSEDGLLLIGRI